MSVFWGAAEEQSEDNYTLEADMSTSRNIAVFWYCAEVATTTAWFLRASCIYSTSVLCFLSIAVQICPTFRLFNVAWFLRIISIVYGELRTRMSACCSCAAVLSTQIAVTDSLPQKGFEPVLTIISSASTFSFCFGISCLRRLAYLFFTLSRKPNLVYKHSNLFSRYKSFYLLQQTFNIYTAE